jgi:hypothetical protein
MDEPISPSVHNEDAFDDLDDFHVTVSLCANGSLVQCLFWIRCAPELLYLSHAGAIDKPDTKPPDPLCYF